MRESFAGHLTPMPPDSFITKLADLGINIFLCDRPLNFLTSGVETHPFNLYSQHGSPTGLYPESTAAHYLHTRLHWYVRLLTKH